MKSLSFISRFCVAIAVMLPLLANAALPMPQDAEHKSIGVVNCASSMCHGAIVPWQDSHILHNEYSTWVRLDKHANAYNVLLNEDSKHIAKKLGLPRPANESKVCLDCHAHNPPAAKRGERFTLSDGVSCEGCHGPAEIWIKSHVEANATHERNIQDGLYPTNRPVEMANLCMSCHFGNEKKLVTHRLMGAGHPRLGFDLDTFASMQPPHYRIDKDWKERKGEYDGVRIWAIGQAVAVRSLLNTLADPVQGRDGLFPELVLFDCHACHHPMSNKRWQPRQGIGPGRIRLNDSNLLMLRNIVRAVNPSAATAFATQIQQVHRTIAGEPGTQGLNPLAETKKLSAMVDKQIRFFETCSFTSKDLRNILRNLIDEGLANGYTDYAGAEQAFMAISSVASYLQKSGAFTAAEVRDTNATLASMRRILGNDENYQPERFKTELGRLRKQLGNAAVAASGS